MISHMFTLGALFAFASSVAATPYDALAPGTLASLARRDTDQVMISCSSPAPGSIPKCICPIDNNGDTGVLINYFPGYQCAYKGGACTWADISGALQNTKQTNCPTSAPCASTGCVCPYDNNGDKGVLINEFKGYQCAYTGGACTWDNSGALTNIYQTNCPTQAKCATK